VRVWSERVHAVDRVGRGEDVCRQWGIIMHKKYDQQLRGLGVRIQGSSKRGFKGPRVQYARAQGSKNWCFRAPRVQWVRLQGSKGPTNAGAGASRRPVKPQAAAGAKMGTAGSAPLVLDGWFWNCGLYATVAHELVQRTNQNNTTTKTAAATTTPTTTTTTTNDY
jgi:hypothetical protein